MPTGISVSPDFELTWGSIEEPYFSALNLDLCKIWFDFVAVERTNEIRLKSPRYELGCLVKFGFEQD